MKYLVISGASRGIGYQTALHFHREGWHIINLSRSKPDLDFICHIEADFADVNWPGTSGQQLIDAINTMPERLVLVHNAARYSSDTVSNLSSESLRLSLEINTVAPLLLNQLLLPTLTHAGGSIIYVGSTLSEKAVQGAAAYVISKHAVVGLMKSTCQDLNAPNIHTLCICPGFTDTEMLRSHMPAGGELEQTLAKRVHANRLLQPEEIANLIFDSSKHAALNGAVIHAHLGQIEQ